jgi:hypothetical protein
MPRQYTPRVECTCQFCGTKFMVKPSKLAHGRGKFCSRSCIGKFHKGEKASTWKGGPVACTCLTCGAIFYKSRASIAIGEGKYCSRACHAVAKKLITGEKHHGWKGGTSVGGNGYVRVNHADGKHGLEHRVIMEAHLGRPLRHDEHVHHLNEDKADNRIENLRVVSASEHKRLYHPQPKIERWSRNHDACVECGTRDHPHGGNGLCKACYLRRYRERRASA